MPPHREPCWPRELYLFKFESLGCKDHEPRAVVQPPTNRLRKAVFVDTSLVEISHWMKVVKHGKAQERRLEELVIIYRGWDNRDSEWEDKASSKCDKPGCNMIAQCMVLPTLKILKVAGLLPDICVFLDFLEAPHLESLDVTAYGEDNVINRIYLQMVQSFKDRCELLARSNVILMPGEPDTYDFKKGVFTSLSLEVLSHLEYV